MIKTLFSLLVLGLMGPSTSHAQECDMTIKSVVETQSSTYNDLGQSDSNNKKLNENLVILDKETRTVPVAAGTFSNDIFARADAKTLARLEGRIDGSLSVGDFTLTVVKGSGQSLIDSPPADIKTLLGASFVDIPLTETEADLAIAQGVSIKSQVNSSSGGAGAATVVLRFTWALG